MLKIAYFCLFSILLIIILFFYAKALKKSNYAPLVNKKKLLAVLAIVSGWLFIQYLIHQTGFYHNLTLPPRIPLFMIVPLFLFSFIFLLKNRNSSILSNIPIEIPIAYQSFRAIIEVLFYYTYVQGILPVQVTFEGANYDVLLGISAILVGIYARRKNASIKFLIVWNILGIGIVAFAAFTFVTSFYFPSIWGQVDSVVIQEFNQFPFLLLPLFFMPSAVFMHLVSILQLTNKRKKLKSKI